MQRKGNCYQAAFTDLMDKFQGEFKLVHGICIGTGPIEGVPFGHAWLESKDGLWVYDATVQRLLTKQQFYNVGQVQYSVTYSFIQASKLMVKNGHWGPWNKNIGKTSHKKSKKTHSKKKKRRA